VEARERLATVLVALDDPDAEAQLREVLRRDPDRIAALETLAVRLLGSGRAEELEAFLRGLSARMSRDDAVDVLLAEALLARDPRSEEAVSLLRTAVARGTNPLRPRGAVLLLRALVAAERFREAARAGAIFFEVAAGGAPTSPEDPGAALFAEGWLLAGVAAHETGEPERAELAYRRALVLDPGSAFARNNLAELLAGAARDKESLREAVAQAREAVRSRPDSPAFRDTLAYALLRADEPEEAFAEWRAAENLYREVGAPPGRLAASLLRRARARFERGESAAARRLLAEIDRLDPTLADGADAARLRSRLGD
jgi:tetratricopeptide (TPR) repeat protein